MIEQDYLERYESYYNDLQSSLESKEEVFKGNEGRGHNSVVMRLMLEESKIVNMYCGSLSVFTEEFYEEIRKVESTESADRLKDKLATALNQYLNKGGRLNVILENDGTEWSQDLIISRDVWDNSVATGHVDVRVLPDVLTVKKNINHFAYNKAGNIARLELNKSGHSAICCFNSDNHNKEEAELFEELLKLSVAVSA